MQAFQFQAPELPPAALEARRRVREFLAQEGNTGRYVPHRCSWSTFDPEFSRRAGAAGFIGVTWPAQYGGQGLSSLVRFVITEEMLAAGERDAPAVASKCQGDRATDTGARAGDDGDPVRGHGGLAPVGKAQV